MAWDSFKRLQSAYFPGFMIDKSSQNRFSLSERESWIALRAFCELQKMVVGVSLAFSVSFIATSCPQLCIKNLQEKHFCLSIGQAFCLPADSRPRVALIYLDLSVHKKQGQPKDVSSSGDLGSAKWALLTTILGLVIDNTMTSFGTF